MSKELNCMNCSIGDFKHDLCDCDNGFCKEFKSIGKQEDFFNAVMQRIRPQEWIPCSERLPKIGEKVLASTKKTVFTQVFKGYHSDPKRWVWENNRVKEIEAWQPLPKPWKGADDERHDI